MFCLLSHIHPRHQPTREDPAPVYRMPILAFYSLYKASSLANRCRSCRHLCLTLLFAMDRYPEMKNSLKADAELLETIPPRLQRAQPPESLRNLDGKNYQELDRKLTRKIDMRLLPIIVLMYTLNYLDRNNIAAGEQFPQLVVACSRC